MSHFIKSAMVVVAFGAMASVARADIDGHGPDAWRVIGVASQDRLNARMGPGADYPVIAAFEPTERGMQQVNCVPLYNAAHYAAMTQQQIKALPAPWCLMRNASLSKAGWVSQRYITPDNQVMASIKNGVTASVAQISFEDSKDNDLVSQAQNMVRELYAGQLRPGYGEMLDVFDPVVARRYFTDDIVGWLTSGRVEAHPLYGAQDFEGVVSDPRPDPDQPMFRGMITINVDFTNFGQKQRAVFYVRPDTTAAGSPLRIFRVEHQEWSYP